MFFFYLTNKMKRSFFQAAVTLILLYGCTTWTLTKRLEKKLDGNYTRMLRAILNKSWRQHPTRHQLYGHLPPITKTIQVRRTRHAGHCWRSRDELISDVLLWTHTHGRAKAGRPARTYIQQLCEDTGCCPEDLPEAMNDREKWRERVRDIRATSTTWWWWYCNVKFTSLFFRWNLQIFGYVQNIFIHSFIIIITYTFFGISVFLIHSIVPKNALECFWSIRQIFFPKVYYSISKKSSWLVNLVFEISLDRKFPVWKEILKKKSAIIRFYFLTLRTQRYCYSGIFPLQGGIVRF